MDFFAIEMLDGHLYLLLDMGSGTTKTKAIDRKVNDGEWYHVDFQRDGRSGTLATHSHGVGVKGQTVSYTFYTAMFVKLPEILIFLFSLILLLLYFIIPHV